MTARSSPEGRRTRIVPATEIRAAQGSRTLRFEGRTYGSGVSFFLVTNDPGQGPDLHRHPYTETWTVLDGRASIQIGDEVIVAGPGDTAVVQQDWHPDGAAHGDTTTSQAWSTDGRPPAALA